MLTEAEDRVYKLMGIGLQNKEIAEILGVVEETIKSHIKNIKRKIKLRKDKEVVAYFWCEVFGTTLEEQRKNILSAIVCLFFLCIIPISDIDKRRLRLRNRDKYIETIENTSK